MSRARYIVIGAGAVGGSLAARLALAGCELQLVARGAHGRAIAEQGLRLRTPSEDRRVRLPVSPSVEGLRLAQRDVVLLAVKSPDTAAAIAALPAGVPVICAQNGVENEELVAAAGLRAYGMLVWMPAVHLIPGEVELYAEAPAGALWLGACPAGVDELAERTSADLRCAGFDSEAVPDVLRCKRGKLLTNLGNVFDAYFRPDPELAEWRAAASEEGESCLRAAGLDYLAADELRRRMPRPEGDEALIEGRPRPGGSTWQSATRGATLELDALNGWIRRLGRRVGVETPVNDALLRLAARKPATRSLTSADLRAARSAPAS